MRNRRILPAMVASTYWPFVNSTRNVVLGSTFSTMPSISIASSLAISSPQIGGPLLRLELVERRPHRIRLEPVGTAIHVLDTRAPHHAVFPRARSAARHVLPHIPRPLPPATRVRLGHHGQLVVREHRPPQAQQGAQPALKVLGGGGYVVPHQGYVQDSRR